MYFSVPTQIISKGEQPGTALFFSGLSLSLSNSSAMAIHVARTLWCMALAMLEDGAMWSSKVGWKKGRGGDRNGITSWRYMFPQTVSIGVLNAFLECPACLGCCVRLLGLVSSTMLCPLLVSGLVSHLVLQPAKSKTVWGLSHGAFWLYGL